ncbi:MAG: hypothetical protein JWP95_480 [Actinotalea sp.]|nr:hypothetical protein [Actinotalea sp.]
MCGVLDARNRLSITKPARALGWADKVSVVFRVAPGRVYVSVGSPTSPLEIAPRYVAGRLTLPAAARARRDVAVGDAVVAVTAGDGQIVLAGGADTAQVITGASDVTPAPMELVAPAKWSGVSGRGSPSPSTDDRSRVRGRGAGALPHPRGSGVWPVVMPAV